MQRTTFAIIILLAVAPIVTGQIVLRSESGAATVWDSGGDDNAGANFPAARTGAAAPVMSSPWPGWVSALASDPTAVWITTPTGQAAGTHNTASYSVPFTLAGPPTNETLTLEIAADNSVGWMGGGGIHINGTPIPTGSFVANNSYSVPVTRSMIPIASLLNAGTNYLEFYVVNFGPITGSNNPAGLLFSATIENIPVFPGNGTDVHMTTRVNGAVSSPNWNRHLVTGGADTINVSYDSHTAAQIGIPFLSAFQLRPTGSTAPPLFISGDISGPIPFDFAYPGTLLFDGISNPGAAFNPLVGGTQFTSVIPASLGGLGLSALVICLTVNDTSPGIVNVFGIGNAPAHEFVIL